MEEKNLEKAIPILKSSDVDFAGIFGSYARGEATEESDIDILVRFSKPKSLLAIVDLEDRLSEAFKKKVDLVTEKSLSPYFRNEVLDDLQIFYGER